MAVRIQFRRGTAAEWVAANPTLAVGELGYETDTAQIKIGNGSADWDNLAYAAVSTSYVDSAIANIVGLAPSTLDTLGELANAVNSDPNFSNTINSAVANAVTNHNNSTTNVHGIANTADLETQSGAESKANTALIYAKSYTDNAIANLIDTAPSTLNTLNELAAALNDDPSFSNTITTSLGTKLAFVVDSETNLSNANAITLVNTIYITPENEGYAKLGDGVTRYNNLAFIGQNYADFAVQAHDISSTNIHGIANTANLIVQSQLTGILADYSTISDTTNAISAAVSTHAATTLNVHGIANTANLVEVSTFTNLSNTVALKAPLESPTFTGTVVLPANTSIGTINSDQISYLANASSNIQNQLNAKLDSSTASSTYAPVSSPTFSGTVSLPETTSIGNVGSTEISYLDNVSSNIQVQLNAKAPSANATFTGNISLPANTSIGDISATEIGHLDNVSSNIQAQLDAKLATSSAASIYAPLSSPTFINSVILPANTTIGSISSTEIEYLDNVTSNIQTQLDSKAPTANPTFTGTVSGITATMVGLGNVNNTADLDKPISNATQSALDAKAPIANATFSGTISLPATTSIGDISATEIGYLDNVSSNIQTQLNAKLSLSGGTMTGDIVLAGAPTQALHPATKAYVDNVSAGLHVHEAAHAATSNTLANLTGGSVTYNNGTDGVGATLTLGTALTTLDGHALTNGDRILVKNEANAAHNGIYVRTSATLLTRADDFNSAAEIAGGDLVFVENGTLYNSTSWVVENEVNTVGTDDILWAQFSGAGTVTAGNNISVSGLQVSVADSPTFTGTVTLPATTSIGPVSGTEIGYLDNVTSNIQTQLNSKANTASPTFTGLVTVAANGIAFTDGTQTMEGVPSRTIILQQTGSYTLTGIERDDLIEMSSTSALTLTIPADSTFNFPVGTSIDILQTNTGQVTIAGAGGVTVNATPGLKLRAQWSSATLFKRAANTWVVYGDLTA